MNWGDRFWKQPFLQLSDLSNLDLGLGHMYTVLTSTYILGSVAVGRWTHDQEVAGSTPTAALFGQQPWASCSHLMCLCSPSSITWYFARAFMLKAPYCWQRHRVQWTKGYCRAVLRWSLNCIEPRYKSSALPFLPNDVFNGLLTDNSIAWTCDFWILPGIFLK